MNRAPQRHRAPTAPVEGGAEPQAQRPAVERLRLRFSRVDAPAAALVVATVTVAAVAAGIAVLPGGLFGAGGVVPPLVDRFGAGELLGWSAIALVTGGLVFGSRGGRPPLLASGLVGSAALLGAGPVECAVIGAAGALGGLRLQSGLVVARTVGGAVLGWSFPGVLAVAATLGGPSLGADHPFSLAAVLALWILMAVAIPLVESGLTIIVLEPREHVGPWHMLTSRIEPSSVLAALAVLAAMSYAAIGPAAGLVVLLPAAAARVGFALHDDGRRAVSQTLAAMTVLPEWVGIVDVGHTARVRGIAERVALDLDLESRVRRDVVRAAELHELGHLDTGADRDDRGRVARSGAAVLGQAGMRDRVTRMVDATDPDRPVETRDADVELGAAIVSTACELDRREPMHDVVEAAQRVVTALGKAHRSAGAFL